MRGNDALVCEVRIYHDASETCLGFVGDDRLFHLRWRDDTRSRAACRAWHCERHPYRIWVGLFEEFYVQGPRGKWLRSMRPLRTIPIYVAIVVVLYLIAVHVAHILLGRLDDLPTVYARLPWGLSFFAAFSVVGILVMRVAHFVGTRTLLDLALGTYHRPVLEKRVLLFLDIQGSTALGERLGAFDTREFLSKFLFDVSKPITDYGGDIYLYTGDGLIASWNWTDAIRDDTILQAVDALFIAVADERLAYERQFGTVPKFRIGVHGGDVVVSEQGDTKRSIGIYGDAINIAARMEQAAKAHGVSCISLRRCGRRAQ